MQRVVGAAAVGARCVGRAGGADERVSACGSNSRVSVAARRPVQASLASWQPSGCARMRMRAQHSTMHTTHAQRARSRYTTAHLQEGRIHALNQLLRLVAAHAVVAAARRDARPPRRHVSLRLHMKVVRRRLSLVGQPPPGLQQRRPHAARAPCKALQGARLPCRCAHACHACRRQQPCVRLQRRHAAGCRARKPVVVKGRLVAIYRVPEQHYEAQVGRGLAQQRRHAYVRAVRARPRRPGLVAAEALARSARGRAGGAEQTAKHWCLA